MKDIYNFFCYLIVILLFFIPVYAVDLENGKLLHDENCLRCHDESKYLRKNRIIKNFQRRYRQKKVNGFLDKETLKISDILAKKSNIS